MKVETYQADRRDLNEEATKLGVKDEFEQRPYKNICGVVGYSAPNTVKLPCRFSDQ